MPDRARATCASSSGASPASATDVTRPYVEALEARGIPHLLVGGRSFHAREEVESLRTALAAVEWPDDELSVYATLKGPLFAIGDEELIEYRQRVPAAASRTGCRRGRASPDASASPIVEALALLRRAAPAAATTARSRTR